MTDKMRSEFEEWYATNAFDYAANPIGSRECGLQWTAWQAARTVPEGYKLVPTTIHPLDSSNCEKVMQLLATPPDAGRIDNPEDYYQYWWSLLLSAAPEGKK